MAMEFSSTVRTCIVSMYLDMILGRWSKSELGVSDQVFYESNVEHLLRGWWMRLVEGGGRIKGVDWWSIDVCKCKGGCDCRWSILE